MKTPLSRDSRTLVLTFTILKSWKPKRSRGEPTGLRAQRKPSAFLERPQPSVELVKCFQGRLALFFQGESSHCGVKAHFPGELKFFLVLDLERKKKFQKRKLVLIPGR